MISDDNWYLISNIMIIGMIIDDNWYLLDDMIIVDDHWNKELLNYSNVPIGKDPAVPSGRSCHRTVQNPARGTTQRNPISLEPPPLISTVVDPVSKKKQTYIWVCLKIG